MSLPQPARAAWPFSKSKKQEPASPGPRQAQTSDSNVETDDEQDFFTEDGQKLAPAPLPEISDYQIKNPAKTAKGYKMPLVRPFEESEISRVQQEIKAIIKLNDSLKQDYSDQAAQIQKITEQSKIHQKILQNLESAKQQNEEQNLALKEAFIEREKVNLIKRETKKNQAFLKDLQEKRNQPTAGTGTEF